jgi:predicted amidohydrolase
MQLCVARRNYPTAVIRRPLANSDATLLGSHHEQRHGALINCGAAADPAGQIIARYEKLRPYALESKLGIAPGHRSGQFKIQGSRVLVLICAGFLVLGNLS